MNLYGKKLKTIHFLWRDKRLVFQFRLKEWDVYESIKLDTIRHAMKVCFGKIEDAVPGSVKNASDIDYLDLQSNNSRVRRYVAESRELLYPQRPRLVAESELVSGYYITTNIAWRDVPKVLRLPCKAANIEFKVSKEVCI